MMEYWGNREILKEKKTAFLCSRKLPASAILKCYDWAKEQRDAGTCVVCGYHSQIEKDVFDILLKGQQPLILVLPRGMKSRWRAVEHCAVAVNRLLVVSPFGKEVNRVTRETALVKNRTILDLGDEIVVGHAAEGGQLAGLLDGLTYRLL